MKLSIITLVLVVALFVCAAPVTVAAPNIYGTGGLMEIPDDTLYAVGTWTPAYHFINKPGDSRDNMNLFTVGTGILPNLSVSGGVKTDGDTKAIINGKFRILSENATRPSVTVGVIDAAAQIADDPGIYIEVGRNLTAAAEEVAGGQSKPLRGYIGLGTGALKGLFAGFDWTLAPKFSAMVEYVGSDQALETSSHFNGGVRYALTNELRVDAGFLDFQDFTAGISYNALRF